MLGENGKGQDGECCGTERGGDLVTAWSCRGSDRGGWGRACSQGGRFNGGLFNGGLTASQSLAEVISSVLACFAAEQRIRMYRRVF